MSAPFVTLAVALLDAYAAGVNREALLAKVAEMDAAGKKPDEITVAVRQLREDAIAKAQEQIDSSS